MEQADGFISSVNAEEKRPKQVQTVPAAPLCNLKDADKIRECLEKKFKDDQETHPEMWDPNWVKKKD
jgi:hypothetical protein